MFEQIEDAIRISSERHTPKFVGFLDELQCAEAEAYAGRARAPCFALYGGYDGAQRKMFGAFPDDSGEPVFPVASLTVSYKSEYKLSHRDFLGTLMSLGLKREAVGDILTGEGYTVMFVKSEIAGYVAGELTKVGGVGVNVSEGTERGLPLETEFASVNSTVSSPRLDACLSALLGKSRGQSSKLISAGLVTVNHRVCLSNIKELYAEDTVSVRGFGKFIIDRIGPLTKKGRYRFEARKNI